LFEGEKTLVFWVGLLVFGYSLAQFGAATWETIYFLIIYPRVYPDSLSTTMIMAQSLYLLIPLIISGIIFAVIGFYMMKKGVKPEQPSKQN